MTAIEQWMIAGLITVIAFVIGWGLGYFKGWSDWF
jgi:hypothetical protein